jgi:hypothetical protein
MPDTFTLIASTTVGSGGTASIDFTSIPSSYTDLAIGLSVRQVSSGGGVWDNITIDFNGVTTNQTLKTLITSDGTSAASQSFTRFFDWIDGAGATASTFTSISGYIPNYAGSTNKSMSLDSVAENNGTGTFMLMGAYLWANTSAINRITFNSNSSTFVQYSTAYIYGVKSS